MLIKNYKEAMKKSIKGIAYNLRIKLAKKVIYDAG